MLNDDEGSALGGLGSILGQFGFGGGSSDSNLDKIIELSRARLISEKVLFTKKSLHNDSDYLANHMIQSLEKSSRWSEGGLLSRFSKDSLKLDGFRFTSDDLSSFGIKENKALKRLHIILVGKERQGGLFQSDFSETSGIMNFSVTSPDPRLSISFVNQLYDNLSDFYLNNSNSKQKKDFVLVESKYDSIKTSLESTMFSIAKFEDENRGLVTKKDAYRLKKLKAEELKLGIMLGEVEKQYQVAQLTMQRTSEYIQVIDRPLLPLKPVNKGRLYYFLLGGFLGGLIGIAYHAMRKSYHDIMLDR